MAATINLSALSFTADQLREMNQLIVKATLEAPLISQFHTMQTGIKNDRQIGIVPGTLGLLGKAKQGCDPTADTPTATAALKTWTPKQIETIIDQCYTDISAVMAKLAAATGTGINDLTSTEYFAFILNLLSKDIPKMILRHAWMGNTSAANVNDSPAGVLTAGVNEAYFNVINGFFVQLATIYGTTAARKTTVAGNSQATQALQFSVLTPAEAATALNAVIDAAPVVLGTQSDKMLLVTHSVYQKAKRYIQGQGLAYNVGLQINGLNMMEWDGIQLFEFPLWDEWILAYENNGTKLNNPHRIVYTTKSNLNIGMEGADLFGNVNVFYDQKSRVNRIEVSDAMDAKILNDDLLQVGI